jgi:subtilisin family serine protease
MSKTSLYKLGRTLVAIGILTTIVGYVLMVVYEDYRPRNYIKWDKKTLEVLSHEKMNKKTFNAMSEDQNTVLEENVIYKTMDLQDPWYLSLAKWLSSVQALSCSKTPEQQPAPTLPAPDPSVPSTQQEDWGYTRIHSKEAHTVTLGKGIKIAVLDTGVQRNHPDLKIAGGINFTTSDRNDYEGRQMHGTHTFGTIGAQDNNFGVVGVCPQCEIWMIKVLGDDGSGTMDWVGQGIIWAADNGFKVISLSLGSSQYSQYVYEATKYARSKGVIIVAAAGNEGNASPNYPASYETVISVSALDSNDQLARYSSYGKVEFAAPGTNILSTCLGGTFCKISGSSMATPHVAGAIALALSVGKTRAASDLLGSPYYFGEGIVNALKSVQKDPSLEEAKEYIKNNKEKK